MIIHGYNMTIYGIITLYVYLYMYTYIYIYIYTYICIYTWNWSASFVMFSTHQSGARQDRQAQRMKEEEHRDQAQPTTFEPSKAAGICINMYQFILNSILQNIDEFAQV